MSERMTDEVWRSLKAGALVRGDMEAPLEECERARASEVAKDAVIKALADAVENLKAEVRRMATLGSAGFSCDVMDHADAALRLVGRR